jgi:hypothetical protein
MSMRTAGRVVAATALLFVVFANTASAQKREADASPITTTVPDSVATQVFVLGTPHLGGVADRFEPAMVDSLASLLDAFGPDAIAIEKISGRQAAAMERWGGRYDRVAQRFAGEFLYHGRQVQRQTGWSWSTANQRADSLLSLARSEGSALATDTRLALVKSLVAAYRLPSATLQWRSLSADARTAQTTLPDTTASALDDRLTAANEVYSIGMRLAHERGHQRLYPIDHQADKDLAVPIFRPLMKAMGDSMRAALDAHPVLQRVDSLEETGLENGELLPFYRYLNRDEVGRADASIQWKTMLDVNLPNDVGRKWLALWETRNLHMAGHIRRVTSQHPGGRVLVIVGSSHKPFFDAYLRQMMGVQVVDAQAVLTGS